MNDQYVTKDSGERREFSTGSRRDADTGKPYIRRIPPLVRERLGAVYRRGADKYGDADDPVENWKKGQPLHEFYESMHRHITKSEMGMEDEDHDAQALWGMCAIIMTKHYIRTGQLPEALADAFNAVVREYGGVEVKRVLSLKEVARLERDPYKKAILEGIVATN